MLVTGYVVGVVFFLVAYPALLHVGPAEAKDVRDVVLKTAAGALALAAGVVSMEGLRLSRLQRQADTERLWTDRFKDAIQMLGSSQVHVRLGALYALERLGADRDSRPVDQAAVWEVISAYVRHRSREVARPTGRTAGSRGRNRPVGEDVQAALTILGRPPDESLTADLAGARLAGARLIGSLCGARLAGANLIDADLRGVRLAGVDLTGADLRGANLTAAQMDADTKLAGACLTGARLVGTRCVGADFTGARMASVWLANGEFRDATFTDAELVSANLSGADLSGANLRDTDLRRATLTRAWLCGADLRGARVDGATLEGTDLTGARLAGLQGGTPAQLRRACGVDPHQLL